MNFARFCRLNAKKFPEREFLIESWPSKGVRRGLTWKMFNEEANKFANYIVKACGVGKGDIVLQFMANSLEMYVIYMAILKTGAVVSPLNYRFAASDVKYAADVAKCKVVIVDEALVSKVEPVVDQLHYVKQFVCVGVKAPSNMKLYSEIIEEGDPSDVLSDTEDDDMAELMFTSGTTGAPKPVCHTHSTLFHIAIGNGFTFGEGYESVNIAAHPLYHSGSLFYSFPLFISAGKVLMPMELQPKSMIESLAWEKATGGWISVPIWSDMINAIKSGELDMAKYDLSALKYIAMGAQPVPTILIDDGKRLFPNLKMMNTYGITEGGGGCTVALYDEDMVRKAGSIGQPGPFMDVKIVNSDGMEAPVGQVGELLLKGPRVMKEYAFNPEMTVRTITDGWLHTGDLAYYDEDGFLYFADRAKDLIIRGGENIFPAEIEDALRKHPKIQDVAVIGYPHPRLVEITMAIIQPKGGVAIEDQEVIDFCREKGLAKYKWPEKFVYAPIPRNPAGKIEKIKLREKYVGGSDESSGKPVK
jgi:acyl-CoA synthetase (AMP-forming)/AMP-acid ligase II